LTIPTKSTSDFHKLDCNPFTKLVRKKARSLVLGARYRPLKKFGGALKLEVTMKKLALAAVLSVAASTAFAGGMAEPMMEPAVVEAATSSSAGGIVVPLLLLLVIAAVASN
jgi:hypothetical protein